MVKMDEKSSILCRKDCFMVLSKNKEIQKRRFF